MKRVARLAVLLAALAPTMFAAPVSSGISSYTDEQAGYAIDYPVQATLVAGLDAALGYNTVFIGFPSENGGEFTDVIITVHDNAGRAPVDVFARERLGLSRDAPGRVRGKWINGMPALLADRPSPLAGEDAAVALVEGDAVIIRIALSGGGVDGPIEPPPEHVDWFNQIVHSIRRVPRQAPQVQPPVAGPDAGPPPPATIFQMPFSVPVETYFAEQYGVAVTNTAYGVRNLGLEHRRTCFGVDWPRLLHAGVDWFRVDQLFSTPTDVFSVADGVVAWYDPNYNNYPGKVVIVQHPLGDGRDLYSVYAHLGPDVSVTQGQIVFRGQRVGSLLYQGDNTHLHFELRYFLDGRNIYGPFTNCNSATLIAGRGYTYRVHPDHFPAPDAGYVDPIAFITASSGTHSTDGISSAAPSVVTSTLRVAGMPLTIAFKDGRAVLVEGSGASVLPDVSLAQPADALIATPMFTPTAFVHLPLIVRNYPKQEPACVEGQQLLLNTGLEDGPSSAPWVQSSNGAADLIQEDRPYSGVYGLWFGGRDLADEEALQSFVLPYYTEGMTVTFQRYVTTAEIQPVPYDVFEVVMENAAGVEVTPRLVLDNTAPQRDQWAEETFVLAGMESLGGRRLQLSLKGSTDASLLTSLFVDEVAIEAHCAP